MDDFLGAQAQQWLMRASTYLADDDSRDPYGAYFSYFICLLIIAKDHQNSSSRHIGPGDENLIKDLFKGNYRAVLDALKTGELPSVTKALSGRLGDEGLESGQSIIFVKSTQSIQDKKYKCIVADLNELARYWDGSEDEDDCRQGSSARACQVFTFLWQIRNNLFHGEKGYGANRRVESDQHLLEDACKITSAIISALLPDAARGFAG